MHLESPNLLIVTTPPRSFVGNFNSPLRCAFAAPPDIAKKSHLKQFDKKDQDVA